MLAVAEAELDALGDVSDANGGGDEVSFVLLAVAGADVGLVFDVGYDGGLELAGASVCGDLELDAVARELDDIFYVYSGAARSGICLGCDVSNAPFGQVDRLFPTDQGWLAIGHCSEVEKEGML